MPDSKAVDEIITTAKTFEFLNSLLQSCLVVNNKHFLSSVVVPSSNELALF